MRERGSFWEDLRDLHAWLQERPSPCSDPNCQPCHNPTSLWDMHWDWSGEVARGWIAKVFRRIFRRG